MSLVEFDDSYYTDPLKKYNCALIPKLERDIVFDETYLLLFNAVHITSSRASSAASSSSSSSSGGSSPTSQSFKSDDYTNSNESESIIPDYIKRAQQQVTNDPEGIIYIDSSDSESEVEEEDENQTEEAGETSQTGASSSSTDDNSVYLSACDDILEMSKFVSISPSSSPQPERDSIINLTHDSDKDYYNDHINICKAKKLPASNIKNAEQVHARPIIKNPHVSRKKLKQQAQKAKETHQQQQRTKACARIRSLSPDIDKTKRQKISRSKFHVRIVKTSVRHAPISQRVKSNRSKQLEGIPYTYNSPVYQCIRCNVDLVGTRKNHQLQQLAPVEPERYHCLGCARFFYLAEDAKERDDMIHWLLTGEIPKYDEPPVLNFSEIRRRLASRRYSMRKRQKRKGSSDAEFITYKELVQLVSDAKYKCCITGYATPFHDIRFKRMPYWSLSIDHKFALMLAGSKDWVWSAGNLQVMAHGLNRVKGHFSDQELRDWVTRFKATNHYIEIN